MVEVEVDRPFYSSLVTEHIVPKGGESAFKRWYAHFVHQAKRFAGFVRADLCPPLRCPDLVLKWYSILHFDTPEHLNDWVESDIRKSLVESGQQIFRAYRFKSFTTGLEGWFSSFSGGSERTGLGAPTWKQILAVVLGLYPIVVLQSKLFSAIGLLKAFSTESATLINILITSTILSLVVMPFISRQFLRFWLQPAYRVPSRKDDGIGAVLVAVALGIMMVVFHQF